MYLFFDTETTGLPRKWDAPITDADNWPRLVQLAWITTDNEGNVLEKRNEIIKPDGFTIPAHIAQIHGITQQYACENGRELAEVMNEFSQKIDEADLLVGHNVSFDECIVGVEFERLQIMNTLFFKPKYCTMKASTNFCKLPGKNGYKPLRLMELYEGLFQTKFNDAHNAMADVEATMKCFWKLKELRVM
ncbi:MAG: 3'-5' exonuclease [Odoribacter sp.]|nr:3'-5' exonuclease [Odoribacter sp.]